MSTKKEIILNGKAVSDIDSFYEEVNRVFMSDEDWEIGNSLDALNDLLYGGFGAIKGNEPVKLIWEDIDVSKSSLGYETTKAYYEQKLKPDSIFNKTLFREKLKVLEEGTGETYFDIIMTIISEHTNIELHAT